jgi:hypothetical protein
MPAPKYQFERPEHHEIVIVDDGKAVGTLRVKPSTILWKAKGKHDYLSVSLDDFAKWIADPATKANKVGM